MLSVELFKFYTICFEKCKLGLSENFKAYNSRAVNQKADLGVDSTMFWFIFLKVGVNLSILF